MKYALKVWFDDSWVYVSEGPFDNLRVSTTEDLEEARAWRDTWIREGQEKVEIVEYQP
jgi:hypothetical protein